MRTHSLLAMSAAAAIVWAGDCPVAADSLELINGTTISNCYVRDEGVRLLVWMNLDEVGGPAKVYPRHLVKSYKIERADAWDANPALPDLSVTFIEVNPKLAGLHGRVHYDKWGRPRIAGADVLVDEGERGYLHPEPAVKNLKLKYTPGEPVTLTAHVKNLGFKVAGPFSYRWQIDGEEVKQGHHTESLEEMLDAAFELPWKWQDGFHEVTFEIVTDQPEIAMINNSATDALWAWPFVYVVNTGRVASWHEFRSAYGTFSWEDFYRWHIDIMNVLFAASVYPSAPEGIKARVRLDRIIYTDDVAQAERELWSTDGLRYDQGVWIWRDQENELKDGQWIQTDHEWRNRTEWSLPHELGHQLGLTDWYALDYGGHEYHLMPDNGDKITHFMRHPITMMHWHGPQPYSEGDAGYLNTTIDKPRGYFGDHYFAIPQEIFLHVVDINGRGVGDARVEVFQRGVVVEADADPGEDRGVRYWPVVEDGNFDHPVSKQPVIVGTTDADGRLRLPNRPVNEVRTLNGFHRRPNPFGNINVVGQRGLLLVRVTKDARPVHFWLEIHEVLSAWFRGQQERYTVVLKTPYGSLDSPPAPTKVSVTRVDEHTARVAWSPPPVRDQHYLDRPLGYRVYRRIGSDGLNDRPWCPLATLGPEARTVTVDLRERIADIYWYSKVNRFAVSTVGDCGVESELTEIVLPQP
ncbi:MAG: fibronectin type III domain-containing protein [Planctomycetes bacterium]|nr:fibronectin type III domain-containing protein [Planctomycetota bacterium]